MRESPMHGNGQRGGVMKHTANRSLFLYWNRLRGDRPAPMRHEIEPAAIGALLSDTYIIEARDDRSYCYRLAGTRVCGYFGRELKGENWLDGWPPQDRETLSTLMRSIITEGTGGLVRFTGENERKQTVSFEVILLPLVNRGSGYSRILGATMPLDSPYWLSAFPIVAVHLDDMTVVWPDNSSVFRPPAPVVDPEAAVPLVRRGHLALYDGGKAG